MQPVCFRRRRFSPQPPSAASRWPPSPCAPCSKTIPMGFLTHKSSRSHQTNGQYQKSILTHRGEYKIGGALGLSAVGAMLRALGCRRTAINPMSLSHFSVVFIYFFVLNMTRSLRSRPGSVGHHRPVGFCYGGSVPYNSYLDLVNTL